MKSAVRPRTKDRELLRQAGEHLGMLAEQAKESHDVLMRWTPWRSSDRIERDAYERYAKLARISRDVLEVASQ